MASKKDKVPMLGQCRPRLTGSDPTGMRAGLATHEAFAAATRPRQPIAQPNQETEAFSVEELETALRWTTAMETDGYRLSVCVDYSGAEELLLVHYPGQRSPVFAIRPAGRTVTLIDALGLSLPFPTVDAALRAMLPTLPPGPHAPSSRARPDCLLALPDILTRPARRSLSWRDRAARILRCVWRFARVSADDGRSATHAGHGLAARPR